MRTCTDVQASTCVRKCTGTRGGTLGRGSPLEHVSTPRAVNLTTSPGTSRQGGRLHFSQSRLLHRTPPCTPALQLLCVVPPQPWGQALKSVEKKPFLPK